MAYSPSGRERLQASSLLVLERNLSLLIHHIARKRREATAVISLVSVSVYNTSNYMYHHVVQLRHLPLSPTSTAGRTWHVASPSKQGDTPRQQPMMSCLRRIGYKVPRDLSLVIPGPNIGCAASNESVMTPIGLMNPIAPSLPKPASRFLANTHKYKFIYLLRGSVYVFGFKLDLESCNGRISWRSAGVLWLWNANSIVGMG